MLTGKRPLSLAMIRKLHAGLGIPAEVLMKERGTTHSRVTAAVAESRSSYRVKRRRS